MNGKQARKLRKQFDNLEKLQDRKYDLIKTRSDNRYPHLVLQSDQNRVLYKQLKKQFKRRLK